MNLLYTGPVGDGVDVYNRDDRRTYSFAPGEPTEVPDLLGARLLEQGNNYAPAEGTQTDDTNPSSDPPESESGLQSDADPEGDETAPEETHQ